MVSQDFRERIVGRDNHQTVSFRSDQRLAALDGGAAIIGDARWGVLE
jgi:hypothetical protein